jgi:restriction system protein
MSIPGFQDIMLPVLQFANDGQEHTWGETYEALASYFGLTQAEIQELLPSGKQSKFQNRVGWAITYLLKTKILTKVAADIASQSAVMMF